MVVKWTGKALSDLARLYDFLSLVNKQSAARTVQSLTAAPNILLLNPRVGKRLEEFDPREVRRIIVGRHEIRYELRESAIFRGAVRDVACYLSNSYWGSSGGVPGT